MEPTTGDAEEPEQKLYPVTTFPPPEAQGEAHGGPLGCCLGTVVGLLLTALLTTIVAVLLSNGAFLGAATLPMMLFGAAVCGYLGWRIGKKLYREYDPPVITEDGKRVKQPSKQA